jgi:pyruvate/2-oxoglutarate dehydrogenase complex dihydrolipoamide acyltransferase (E2) component
MRLFGRSANQVSTKPPDALDVPPELRPYYREQAVAARTRYAAVRVLATLAVLAVLAGAGTWVWLNHHAIGHTITSRIAAITDQVKKKPSSQSATKTNQGSPAQKNKNTVATTDNPPAAPQPPPATTPTPSSSGSGSNQSTGQQQPSPTPQPVASPSVASAATPSGASTSIPNTGPGTTMLYGVLSVSLLGAAAHQAYVRRTARSRR